MPGEASASSSLVARHRESDRHGSAPACGHVSGAMRRVTPPVAVRGSLITRWWDRIFVILLPSDLPEKERLGGGISEPSFAFKGTETLGYCWQLLLPLVDRCDEQKRETEAYVAEVAALKPEDTARRNAKFQERRGNDLPEDADVGVDPRWGGRDLPSPDSYGSTQPTAIGPWSNGHSARASSPRHRLVAEHFRTQGQTIGVPRPQLLARLAGGALADADDHGRPLLDAVVAPRSHRRLCAGKRSMLLARGGQHGLCLFPVSERAESNAPRAGARSSNHCAFAIAMRRAGPARNNRRGRASVGVRQHSFGRRNVRRGGTREPRVQQHGHLAGAPVAAGAAQHHADHPPAIARGGRHQIVARPAGKSGLEAIGALVGSEQRIDRPAAPLADRHFALVEQRIVLRIVLD